MSSHSPELPAIVNSDTPDSPSRTGISLAPRSEITVPFPRPVIRTTPISRGVAQSGSAPRSGRGGRGFESRRPDHAGNPSHPWRDENPRSGFESRKPPVAATYHREQSEPHRLGRIPQRGSSQSRRPDHAGLRDRFCAFVRIHGVLCGSGFLVIRMVVRPVRSKSWKSDRFLSRIRSLNSRGITADFQWHSSGIWRGGAGFPDPIACHSTFADGTIWRGGLPRALGCGIRSP